MQQYDEHQIRIKYYILGTLEQEKRQEIEERFLTDNDYFNEILKIEDELMDEYINGGLSAEDRERFEQQFLTISENRQKLNFAMALNRYVKTAESNQALESDNNAEEKIPYKRSPFSILRTTNPIPKYVFIAASILLVCAASWLVFNSLRRERTFPGNKIGVALRPGLVRDSGEIKKISFSNNVETLVLKLELAASDYNRYRAIIQSAEGIKIFEVENLESQTSANGNFVILPVASKLLANGDYQIKLSGLTSNAKYEDIDSYYFRISIN